MRSPVPGEIKAVSVTQSSTWRNNEAEYGAHLAIDGDMDTNTHTYYQSDPSWFKAKLDRGYCITTVVQHSSNRYQPNNTYTCSQDTCSCEGQCYRFSLSVYREDGTVPGPDAPSGCKLGDTVKISLLEAGGDFLWIYELVIIPRTVGRLRR